MKMSKAEAKAEAMPAMAERPEYPYGLCIRLGKEEIAKLGLKAPTIGDAFDIDAKCVVKSMSASAGEGGDYMSIELQITDMELESDAEDKKDNAAKNLYGKMSEKMAGPNS